jgi:molybdopterin-guanine dinucleotide biosynthesis protein A
MNGYVLAGGKSSRMGQDKGLMPFGNHALVEYSIFALRGLVDHLFLVTANTDYERFNLPLVVDTIKDLGPAGGILTALQHTDSELNIVLSCDMPFMQSRWIKNLLEQRNDATICIYTHDGFIEPMCGVYSKKALPSWQTAVQSGTRKLEYLLEKCDAHYVPFLGDGEMSPFANLNTPEAFTTFSKYQQFLTNN